MEDELKDFNWKDKSVLKRSFEEETIEELAIWQREACEESDSALVSIISDESGGA